MYHKVTDPTITPTSYQVEQYQLASANTKIGKLSLISISAFLESDNLAINLGGRYIYFEQVQEQNLQIKERVNL